MSPAGDQKVAVIIPVRDRRELLRQALDALDRQTYRDFDVIVVDDGSTDGSDEEALAHPVAGRPVQLVRSGGGGAVHARQRGCAAAQWATVLAFTDSDCMPAATWLAAAVRQIEAGAALVSGPTLPARDVLPLERSVTDRNTGLFPTCNLAVSRAAFDEVGGFDARAADRFGFRPTSRARGLGFGEDTVFGWAIARQQKAAYDDEMLVRHHVFSADLRDQISRSLQVGAFPALVREVPELRRTLVRSGVLFGKRSRLPVYATASALLLQRPKIAGLTLTWWAVHRWRHSIRWTRWPLSKQLRALPPQMLLDAVQAGAIVAGSVRYRTVLL